jgi:cysteinyl-tRNA synthetase
MIHFYNTLHRRLEEFSSIEDDKVKIYTCGPTVYDYAHIGNFRAYIFEDLLRRFLQSSGYEVNHVMNITDIDDKTIRKSIEEKKELKAFTTKYVDAFFEDIKTLNILPAHQYPRATDFVDEMISMTTDLIEKGHGYVSEDGSVFFDISSYSEYGKLANLDPDQMQSGTRVENDEYQKSEGRDFALWKGHKTDDGNVSWDSPWGKGRPGWHIECSVMSTHYLGNHFDIHCGGVDNIFPHHENEIAQSCAATGESFVNYWLHNEHLRVDNQKMSKSLNNYYTLRDLIKKGFTSESIRYTLISTHYRQRLNFTFEKLDIAQKAINRLRELKRRLELVENEKGKSINCQIEIQFQEKLSDDLNISGALGELFTWANTLFSLLDDNQISTDNAIKCLDSLSKVDSILGVIQKEEMSISEKVEELIEKRKLARQEKKWTVADQVRAELDSMGIALEDTTKGTIWKLK